MKLRDLLLKMTGDERVLITEPNFVDSATTVDEIVNNHEELLDKTVAVIWTSYNIYKAIMIELE